jgi:transglutaminase-like putative cysteine protease
MRQIGFVCLGVLLLAGRLLADSPQGRLIEDVWEVAQLEGARIGFFNTTVREVERAGSKVLRTTQRMELTLKRFNAMVRLQAETGTEETREGKVTAVFMRMPQERGQLVLNGTVTAEGLHVQVDGGRINKVIPWNHQVLGLYRQERLFQDRKLRPGDRFSYLSYEPTINSMVTVRGRMGDEEEVQTLAGRQRLLRVEATPDKVEASSGGVQLPGVVMWLDKDLLPVRRQMELPGLGQVISSRTSREVATGLGGGPVRVPEIDIGKRTLIPLNRTLRQPQRTRSVVYRITIKGDEDPGTAFARDARQEVKHLRGNTFDLHVRAVRSPQKVDAPNALAKEEFLKSCYYLNSDDSRVRRLARQAVEDATEPLQKARLIERWVHDHMDHDNSVGFAPADQVARSLRGDCRQHAMLTAAMCRAVGVPSQTAVGLVYGTDGLGRPVMAFHMWTEVWVQGQWLAIDATLGQGSIGADHVKIAAHSWYDTQSLTPMLSVARVLGKISIEVVDVEDTP